MLSIRVRDGRPLWLIGLVIALLPASCDEDKDEDEDKDVAVDEGDADVDADADTDADADADADSDTEYFMASVSEPDGCTGPTARRFHQMAWFLADPPLEIGSLAFPVERGFLVVGGIGLRGAYFDDLWLYDLTNARPSACPWHLLRGTGAVSGSTGIAGGSLTFDTDNQRFVLIGGHREDANGNVSASNRVDTLPIEALGPGSVFTHAGALPAPPYQALEFSAPLCSHPPNAECRNLQTCVVTESVGVDACTGTADVPFFDPMCGDSSVPGAYDGCFEDPVCTRLDQGFVEIYDQGDPTILDHVVVERVVSGLSQFAVVQDPASPGVLTLVGGTTGCEGSSVACAAWIDLADADQRGISPSLSTANPRVGYTVAGVLPSAPFDVDLGPWDIPPFFDVDLQEDVPWPTEGSRGIRFSAGVFPGRRWDPDERSWLQFARGEPFAVVRLFGGTRAQLVASTATNTVELHDGHGGPEPDCWPDQWPSQSQWEGPLPPDWFVDRNGDGLVGEGDAAFPSEETAALLVGDEIVLDPIPGMPSGLYQTAAVAVQDDAILLIGGRTFSRRDGASDVWRVDLEGNSVSSAVVTGDTEPRYGAAAVFDPIERRTYVFGGEVSDGGTEDCTNDVDDDADGAIDCADPSCAVDVACVPSVVYTIESPADVVHPNETSSFDIDAVDLEYEFVPKAGAETAILEGTWVARMGFHFTHTCAPALEREPPGASTPGSPTSVSPIGSRSRSATPTSTARRPLPSSGCWKARTTRTSASSWCWTTGPGSRWARDSPTRTVQVWRCSARTTIPQDSVGSPTRTGWWTCTPGGCRGPWWTGRPRRCS